MSTGHVKIEEEILIRLLLESQPHSKDMLEFLRRHFANKRGHGAFAPIEGERCGACNLSIAQARLQRAKNGTFISCAYCSRFLYLPEAVLVENNTTESEEL
jgi:predicted  nucleic acid-binding Zn-ribbon protein